MAMVDEFLDQLTEDYTTLYKENATLKAKMKVLVDKVEEHRSTEEAMRKALMTAQRMADDLVKEAEQKKTAMLREAEGEAQRGDGKQEEEMAAVWGHGGKCAAGAVGASLWGFTIAEHGYILFDCVFFKCSGKRFWCRRAEER